MKKIFLLSLFLLFGATLHAQLTIVPKVGLSYYSAKLGEDSYGSDNMKFKAGFLVGAGFDITITDFFSIKPELVYIQKGWKGEYNDVDQGYGYIDKSEVTLNYIEIPIMFKFTFGGGVKFFVNGGPYIGFGLNGKDKWDFESYYAGTIDYSESGEYKIKFGSAPDNIPIDEEYIDNPLEIGGQAGAGVLIANHIHIEIRYSYALTNMFDENPDVPDNTSKNYGLQLFVAIPLSLH